MKHDSNHPERNARILIGGISLKITWKIRFTRQENMGSKDYHFYMPVVLPFENVSLDEPTIMMSSSGDSF